MVSFKLLFMLIGRLAFKLKIHSSKQFNKTNVLGRTTLHYSFRIGHSSSEVIPISSIDAIIRYAYITNFIYFTELTAENYCSGVIVSKYFVLTAASCLGDYDVLSNETYIQAGIRDASDKVFRAQYAEVKHQYIHPEFNKTG